MQTGTISVQTENIFPIIKKFLYSDHEIFLRELVSNAVDATTKLQVLAQRGEVSGEIGDTHIEIIQNPADKQIIIRDRGIGMTEEEVLEIPQPDCFFQCNRVSGEISGQRHHRSLRTWLLFRLYGRRKSGGSH